MRLPKVRELKEAVTAVFSPRFTTRFPAEPCVVPDSLRGKPEFDQDTCIGCGACVNVCPTRALTQADEPDDMPPMRRITLRHDACIFCGNCEENCTTETGIALTTQWDLATLDRHRTHHVEEYELQLCEKCGAIVGTKKQLQWLYDRLGPLAYSNPSVLLSKTEGMPHPESPPAVPRDTEEAETSDFMRILCPECRAKLNLKM